VTRWQVAGKKRGDSLSRERDGDILTGILRESERTYVSETANREREREREESGKEK